MPTIIRGVGASGAIGPTSGGKVYAVNNVGTTGAQVIAGNTSRVAVSFHNPGTNSIYVYPLLNALGGANAPTLASPGGSFLILPGATSEFSGEVQGAWAAFATAGSTNPLTVMDSNV